jgi:hypothetical protein
MDRRSFFSKLARFGLAGATAGNLSHLLPSEQPSAENRTGWMRTSKWGVMTHYLADWIAGETGQPMSVERWNDLVNHFDVHGLADQIHSVGVGYYQISIGQNSGYYLAPNLTYDRLVGIHPSKCSRRDLVSDLYGALQKRGIRLMVYLPSGAPAEDATAVEALGWKRGPDRNREFQLKWQQVIQEWSRRWGRKISGWWFDGCFWPNSMYRFCQSPNFASFAAAARAGNSESALAFNPGVYHRIYSPAPDGDYIAGEIDFPALIEIVRAENGLIDGAQMYILSHLGEKWGMGTPRFSTDDVVAWTRKVVSQNGAFTWDTPVQANGHISKPFMDQLTMIGRAMGQD